MAARGLSAYGFIPVRCLVVSPHSVSREVKILIKVAAVERPRGLGRWSLMREVQSSIPRRGYIPHVTAEMQWLGVTPPAVTSGKPTGELAPRCKPRYRAVVPPRVGPDP